MYNIYIFKIWSIQSFPYNIHAALSAKPPLRSTSINYSKWQQMATSHHGAPAHSSLGNMTAAWVQDHHCPPVATELCCKGTNPSDLFPIFSPTTVQNSRRDLKATASNSAASLITFRLFSHSQTMRKQLGAIFLLANTLQSWRRWIICLSSFACKLWKKQTLMQYIYFFLKKVFIGYLRFKSSLRNWNNQDVARVCSLTDQFFLNSAEEFGSNRVWLCAIY